MRALIARQGPRGLELIDGHLRAELDPDQVVPVLVLDVDATEATTLLASLDPLAAMAATDPEALQALLAQAVLPEEILAARPWSLLAPDTGHPDPEEACQHLVDAALSRGGPDNVTIVVARYRMT